MPIKFTDASTKADNANESLKQIIASSSTNIRFLEDFIFEKGYIKKKILNASFTALEPLRNHVRLVGVKVSKSGNLRLVYLHEQSGELAFYAAKQ